jgi:hypothetical protein
MPYKCAWGCAAQGAIARLDALSEKLKLNADFNGFSLLLLSESKLEVFLKFKGKRGEEVDIAKAMEAIRSAANPLTLAADDEWSPLSTIAELGQKLYPVDRDEEYLAFIKTAMQWEVRCLVSLSCVSELKLFERRRFVRPTVSFTTSTIERVCLCRNCRILT